MREMFTIALRATALAMVVLLLWPAISSAQGPIQAIENIVKPAGSAESNVILWLPLGSVNQEFEARADYVAEEDLPAGVSYPDNVVGQAFTFGLWGGDSTTLTDFDPSIVISMKYSDSDVPTALGENEESIHLLMYDPTAGAWLKLCSSVDIYDNAVFSALTSPTPLDGKGSSLMALAVDDTPPLDQEVDNRGSTTITLPGSGGRFRVPKDTVELGTHFVVTMVPGQLGGRRIKLFSEPLDIKGCKIDHDNPSQNNRQLITYGKPLRVGFNYDADTLSRAGGQSNLTLVNTIDGRWLDLEEVGSRVIRRDDVVSVDTRQLGTFGLAAR